MNRRFDTNLIFQSMAPGLLGRITMAGYFRAHEPVNLHSMRVLGYFAVVLVLRGGGRFVQANSAVREVSAGDLLWVFPEVPHRYGPGRGQHWEEFYIVFEGEVFELWRRQGLISPQEPRWHLDPLDYWLGRMNSCVREVDGSTDPLRQTCRLQQFIADAAENRRRQRRGGAPAWLMKACELLSRSSSESMEEIAIEVGLSYENFRKRFTELTTQPPAKYRSARLLELACQMLVESDATIKGVAHRCGFCDAFHFSRRFKQMIGMSPSDYRGRALRR